MIPEEEGQAIRFALWQIIQFSLNHPDFIADLRRQINALDEAERPGARAAARAAFSRLGISDEQIEQFLQRIGED